jgi:hypothetical protein
MTDRPLPPDPAGGQCCDWGYCTGPSNGWRWHNEHGWLPVCDNHTGGPKAAKAGAYVADTAMVWREGAPRQPAHPALDQPQEPTP